MVCGTLAEADVVLFLIDATQAVGPGDRLIAERLSEAEAEVIVVVSKLDIGRRSQVVEQLTRAGSGTSPPMCRCRRSTARASPSW